MYDTVEFYDSNGCDLKEVLKSCIYKYYIANKNSLKLLKNGTKNNILNSTNEVTSERS